MPVKKMEADDLPLIKGLVPLISMKEIAEKFDVQVSTIIKFLRKHKTSRMIILDAHRLNIIYKGIEANEHHTVTAKACNLNVSHFSTVRTKLLKEVGLVYYHGRLSKVAS